MKVLVYGWYHQANIGDDLFISAFPKLFPRYQFVFYNHITLKNLEDVDAVFLGGGSFLDSPPYISSEALEKLKDIPIFYVGVGVEAYIHPTHMELIKDAQLIATRSLDQMDRLKELNPKVVWAPDLAYSLQDQVQISPKKGRSVLILPNISVVPSHMETHWKHSSWSHFKTEFAQFLDDLLKDDYQLSFYSMCRGNKDNDDWAAGEIISHMSHRGPFLPLHQPTNLSDLTALMSQYDLVITQRFHGIVLAEMTQTPYIAIHHHDKLKYAHPANGAFVSYWNASKQTLSETFHQAIRLNFASCMPIAQNTFETLSQQISELVENGSLCRH